MLAKADESYLGDYQGLVNMGKARIRRGEGGEKLKDLVKRLEGEAIALLLEERKNG